VRARVFYQRANDQVNLATATLSLADSRATSLSIDVSACEIDARRVPVVEGACSVAAELLLMKGSSVLDSTVVGPANVRAGDNVAMPPATLYEVATVQILSPTDGVFRFEPETTLVLTATALDKTGAIVVGDSASWLTGASSIATIVGATGALTTVAPGRTSITVTIGGRTATSVLEVTPLTARHVTVAAPSTTLTPGRPVTFTASYVDRKGRPLSGRTVTWTSSDSTIATVSQAGVVVGIAGGTAKITASVDGVSDGVTVTVAPPQVASVTVSLDNPTPNVGQTTQATATSKDAQGNVLIGRPVSSWVSSNPSVATVSASGVVTAVSAGAATITATVDGVVSSPATVTVRGSSVSSVRVTLSASTVLVGQTVTATAAPFDVFGAPLTGRTVSAWTSSNPSVATVNANGIVTALTAGVTIISATIENITGASGVLTVTVPGPNSVTVTIVPSTLVVGQVGDATAVVRDSSGVTQQNPTIVWSSSNTAVATVSSSGVVTAISAGTVSIIASSGGRSGSTSLTITP
jgi:uncharacterized protein YjdB